MSRGARLVNRGAVRPLRLYDAREIERPAATIPVGGDLNPDSRAFPILRWDHFGFSKSGSFSKQLLDDLVILARRYRACGEQDNTSLAHDIQRRREHCKGLNRDALRAGCRPLGELGGVL